MRTKNLLFQLQNIPVIILQLCGHHLGNRLYFVMKIQRTFSLLLLVILYLGVTHGALKKVSSSGEFQSALDGAKPGDTIQLAPAVFMGEFVASSVGPITITGDVNSTIVSEGTGLTLKGSKWTVKSLKITEPNVGILIEGNENNLESVVIQKVGKGVVVRGQENKIKSIVISEAEGGIIIEADKNELYYNSINIQAPSITLEENTCCGLLNGNVANGRVDVRGSKYTFTNNVANHGMYVTGCDNSFSGNVANGASFPKECASNDLGGNVYRGLGPNDTDPPQPGQNQQGASNNGGSSGHGGGSGSNSFMAQVNNGGGNGGGKPTCTCTCV